ncbi:MAG: hypothetical protein HQK99_16620 [Nitrospirae bacterium]|nr:hypothetical protein [Nitrospirota bacterium]
MKGAELSDKFAKEIAGVFREIIEDRLVTKKDMDDVASMTKYEFEAEIEKSKSELELKIESVKSETLKWMFVFWAGQLIVVFAMFKTFLK